MKKENIRELFFYGVFGILTTIINLLTFKVLNETFGLYYMWSNVVAWIAGVVFAFVTNKIFVFQSYNWKMSVWLKEASEFISARLLTGIMDMALMYLLVSGVHVDEWYSKIVVNILVIIGNYILSKLWVFKR